MDIIIISILQGKNLWHIEAEQLSRITEKVVEMKIPAHMEPSRFDSKVKLLTNPNTALLSMV